MTKKNPDMPIIPWSYGKRRKNTRLRAESCIREWEFRIAEKKRCGIQPEIYPTICFSRPVGCGVIEIADILAKRINYCVVDREILEYADGKTPLRSRAVQFFNEQYPDFITQYIMMIGGEKPFVTSDNTYLLFRTIFSIANLGPTIFIGRGAYLLLPRDRTLAIRFICERKRRIKSIAEVYGITHADAEKKLGMIDREQENFFRAVYNQKKIKPEGFDMVINCDFITDPDWAADIVETAFKSKFNFEFKHM